jgi:hypothetical protein
LKANIMSQSFEAAPRVIPSHAAPSPAFYGIYTVAKIDGRAVSIRAGASQIDAVLAEHLLAVLPGQVVAVIVPESTAMPALVVAAYPMKPDAISAFTYDSATETLTLTAKRLRLVGENGVEILGQQCRVSLQPDGTFEVRAEQIISSAVETHRIEGGAIELN